MKRMTALQKACWWAVVVFGVASTVGLVVWSIVGDLSTAATVGSIVSAVAGVVALGVALRQLFQSPPASTPIDRSIIAAGEVVGSSTGDIGPPPSTPQAPQTGGITRSIISGGGVRDSSTGDDRRPGTSRP
jgi:hypothetical protein